MAQRSAGITCCVRASAYGGPSASGLQANHRPPWIWQLTESKPEITLLSVGSKRNAPAVERERIHRDLGPATI